MAGVSLDMMWPVFWVLYWVASKEEPEDDLNNGNIPFKVNIH